MFDPKSIEVSQTETGMGHISIHVRAQVNVFRECVPQYKAECTQESQVKAWSILYGDIERKVEEVRRRVLPELAMGSNAYSAFDDLLAMLRNPFTGPRPNL